MIVTLKDVLKKFFFSHITSFSFQSTISYKLVFSHLNEVSVQLMYELHAEA